MVNKKLLLSNINVTLSLIYKLFPNNKPVVIAVEIFRSKQLGWVGMGGHTLHIFMKQNENGMLGEWCGRSESGTPRKCANPPSLPSSCPVNSCKHEVVSISVKYFIWLFYHVETENAGTQLKSTVFPSKLSL